MKERKFASKRQAALFAWLSESWDNALLGVDFIEAFWKALPKEFRTPGAKTPQAMLADLYKNFGEVDIDKAIEGIIKAIIWEKLGGKLDQYRREIARRLALWKGQIRTY